MNTFSGPDSEPGHTAEDSLPSFRTADPAAGNLGGSQRIQQRVRSSALKAGLLGSVIMDPAVGWGSSLLAGREVIVTDQQG